MGEATLSHGDLVHRFRVDPNEITWNYRLNTHVDNTYGGRVVQVLSAYIDDLVVQADAGMGGWDYINSLALFCRDFMFRQYETGEPGVFRFPQRNWELKVYLKSIPFADHRDDVKKSYMLRFKVQEDVNGIIAGDTVSAELNKIKDGIGYERNQYNYPVEETGEEELNDGGSAVSGTTVPDAMDASGFNVNKLPGTNQSSALTSRAGGYNGGGRADWTGAQPKDRSRLLQTADYIQGITTLVGQANSFIGTITRIQSNFNR